MKILIIRLSSLGDVILSTFMVRMLHNIYPNAKIDFLVAKEFSIVFKYNPRINKILEYDKSLPFYSHLLNTFSINNPSHYDVIIDLQNNIRSWVYSWGKSSTVFRFNKRRFYKLKLVYLKSRPKEFLPIPILYRDTFPSLQQIDDKLGLELWTSKDEGSYKPHSKTLDKIDLKRIAIAPGAKHFTKIYPPEKYVELIKFFQSNFNSEIYLLGGETDRKICWQISEKCSNVSNLCGELDVIQTAEFLDDINLVISNDSAVVHIASARKVPVVVIYGSTVPAFGFIPFRTKSLIIENNSVNCRPCTHYGRSNCPKKHFNCMNELKPEEIFNKISNFA
ncbi:MAG: glycosyltransferase family 9 protein [Ignavibacteria bacterium]|nr:glycosyltransferase family 9 protein [Ignavibacteria bacterium]